MAAKLHKSRKPRSLPAPIPATDSPSEVYEKSLAKVAERLGVNPHTLGARRKHGQIPGKKGAWPMIAIAAAMLDGQNQSEEKEKREREKHEVAMEAKRLDLDERRLKLDERQKLLITRAKHEELIDRCARVFVSTLDTLVAELPAKLGLSADGTKRLEEWINARRLELSSSEAA